MEIIVAGYAESRDFEEAQAAKAKLARMLWRNRQVRGIGITRVGGRYAVKLNLAGTSSRSIKVPDEIDGVPIKVEFVGEIVPYGSRANTLHRR